MISRTPRARRTFLAGMLYTMEADGNLLPTGSGVGPLEILRNKNICENISATDNEFVESARGRSSRLLRFCFSVWESKRCRHQNKSSRPGGSSISRTMQTPQKELMGKRFSLYSHIFWGAKSNGITIEIDDRIGNRSRDDGEHQETYPHRIIFMGMMNEIPMSSEGLAIVEAQLVQDAERSADYFGKFRPAYFMHTGPGSEKDLELR